MHTRLFFSLSFCLGLVLNTGAQSTWQPFQNDDRYQVRQDLTGLRDSLLPIEVVTPLLRDTAVEYHLPRIIPGTYSVANYGQFVRNFTALSVRGDSLPVKRLDLNRWRISKAGELYKIKYDMTDSYRSKGHDIFEPAGTSHRDSVFLLNNFGYLGYLQGYGQMPYELEIKKPRGFYGATALRGVLTDSLDRFLVADYFTLHDSPLLYTRPDTASRNLGGARVEVSVYSPNGLVNASESLEAISPVLEGATEFFGGSLPVDKYAVLIYTVPLTQIGGGYGALEHQKSTVLYLPEMGSDFFYESVRDITAHEFFHLLTPLGLHSEQVHNFNFINPEMSQHLWLYEGVTEYNSHLVQARSGIYDLEQFLEVLRNKMQSADQYDEHIPLTLASRYTLEPFKDQYLNFYQKGALAAMALDIKLLELSEGEMRLIDLLQKLRKTYTADTFFYDDRLFAEMEAASYPGLNEFLLRHFAGTAPLPLEELLALAGFDYQAEGITEGFSLGADDFSYSFETERIRVASAEGIDAFGESLGLEEGDEILSINGEAVNLDNINLLIQQYYEEAEVGQKLVLRVARQKRNGKFRTKKLKAKIFTVSYEEAHLLNEDPEANEEQLAFRALWLGHP